MGKHTYERHATDILCPFFIGKERSKIVCEGLIAGSHTSISFKNPADCVAWRSNYCRSDHNSCEIHIMLTRKYQ